MKRRNFIIMATSSLAAISIPTTYYYFGDVEYDGALAQPQSLFLIWDIPTIDAVGNAYRLQVPSEKRERALVKLLADPSADGTATALSLEQRIKKDFETGNTVMIDGWVLSVTEARQCALSSLTQPN